MTTHELALFLLDEPDRDTADPIRPGTRGGARWSAHNGRVRCDACRADQAAGLLASVARAARWRLQGDGEDRYLCYEHARVWRERDANGGGR